MQNMFHSEPGVRNLLQFVDLTCPFDSHFLLKLQTRLLRMLNYLTQLLQTHYVLNRLPCVELEARDEEPSDKEEELDADLG